MSESSSASHEDDRNFSSSPISRGVDHTVYIELLRYMHAQLPAVANYVEEGAVSIVEEFKRLSLKTKDQSENMARVVDVARSIDMGGEKIPYEESVKILYEPLSEAITKILQVSKLAMSMVMTIGNAADNISKVEQCIEQVQTLTRQTNMLAMNTQIEAARAGDAGRSFRIIAQEVKALSENIRSISNQIQSEVLQVSTSVKKSSEVVDNLAYYDMTDNLELKEKIDSLIDSIVNQNARFGHLLKDSAQSADEVSQTISELVMGIQFQDRNSQVLGDFRTLLERIIAHLEQEQAASGVTPGLHRNQYDDTIRDLIADIRLSDIRNQALSHLHQKGALADDSPLYEAYLKPKDKPKPQEGLADILDEGDDDDIELF